VLKRLVSGGTALLLLCAGGRGVAQGPAGGAESEGVRKAVETYLYAENVDEKKPVSDAGAKVFAVDQSRGRVASKPLSSPPPKLPKGGKILRSPQRIASIEILNDAAAVKVSTDLTPDDPADEANTHYQLIWLLRVRGEWKIVGILMPTPTLRPAGR